MTVTSVICHPQTIFWVHLFQSKLLQELQLCSLSLNPGLEAREIWEMRKYVLSCITSFHKPLASFFSSYLKGLPASTLAPNRVFPHRKNTLGVHRRPLHYSVPQSFKLMFYSRKKPHNKMVRPRPSLSFLSQPVLFHYSLSTFNLWLFFSISSCNIPSILLP